MMVRGAGLEPAHHCWRQDLNLVRLPISPSSPPGTQQRSWRCRRPDIRHRCRHWCGGRRTPESREGEILTDCLTLVCMRTESATRCSARICRFA
ncbi:protein of unknown function [Paraburkholderia kururiensis]